MSVPRPWCGESARDSRRAVGRERANARDKRGIAARGHQPECAHALCFGPQSRPARGGAPPAKERGRPGVSGTPPASAAAPAAAVVPRAEHGDPRAWVARRKPGRAPRQASQTARRRDGRRVAHHPRPRRSRPRPGRGRCRWARTGRTPARRAPPRESRESRRCEGQPGALWRSTAISRGALAPAAGALRIHPSSSPAPLRAPRRHTG